MNISRYKRAFCRVCLECVTVFSYEGPNYVQCLPSIEMEWLSLFFFLLPGNAFADCKRAREKWELRGGELIYLFFFLVFLGAYAYKDTHYFSKHRAGKNAVGLSRSVRVASALPRG